MKTVFRLMVVAAAYLCLALGSVCELSADELVDRIHSFVTEDTVLVAHVNVDQLDVSVLAGYVSKLIPEVGSSDQFRESIDSMDAQVRQFRRAGGHEVYLLLSLQDLKNGPVIVVPLGDGADRDVLRNLLSTGDSKREPQRIDFDAEVFPGSLLVAGSPQARGRLRTSTPVERPGLAAALAAAGESPVRVAIVPSNDHRRALSEMAPPLPGPWRSIELGDLGEVFQWSLIAVDLPPEPKVAVTLQTRDEASAKIFLEQIGKAIEVAGQTPVVRQKVPGYAKLAGLWHPSVLGSKLSIELDDRDDGLLTLVREVLAPPIAAARKAAGRARRINQFRQLAIAMANHESANGHYPAQAIVDEKGKPLLSWRVSVLPYLEEHELYDQFHVDEPWDSEHNRELISRMPDVFADEELGLGKAGRTTFVVPVGKGTVFDTQEGTKVREIRDGVSKTVLLVEVDPVQSVIWTKPDDWQVDMDQPLRGVRRSDRSTFIAARCDASVQAVSNNVDSQLWKALLTKDAGERTD